MRETITLGGRTFQLRPLKLGQLRRLVDALDAMGGQSGGALIAAAADVVVAGLAPAHPDLSAEALLDLEAGVAELNEAVAAVLRVAGLRPAADTAAGEAGPVAEKAPAMRSAPSTAPSPPAATGVGATSTP
ncbi:MAG TPA: hypothetical protein VME41_03170 [Stellaceae bacterium]|nr:hypothetical protein [Stellaceae bacterium]